MSFKLQKINNNNKIESFKSVDLALDHSGSLSSYISYVNSIPLLSSDEEYNLAKDYKENGNKDSCHKIVLSHLRVVVSIAAKLSRKTKVDIGDLISEGNYALMHAADKFDYKKGYRFVTYAIWWIKAAIEKYIKNLWNFSNNLIDVSKKYDNNASENSYSDGIESVADRAGVSFIDELDNEMVSSKIKMIVNNLPQRERDIFISRVYDEQTLDEISMQNGVSKERVRQIFAVTLEKIKKNF
jgi:RNA polymerase sigma factor (sigma-70 family)